MMLPTALTPLFVSRITVFTVGLLLVLKVIAYIMSGSTAILSSVMDGLTDIGLSTMTLIALTWSAKPKDDNHRHGHSKIEGVSALLQAAFMIGAASFLILQAITKILKPEPIEQHLIAGIIMAIIVLVSYFISKVQSIAIKSSESVALKADHAHYATDSYLNAAILTVIILDAAGIAPLWFDPLVGIVVAGIFIRTAYNIAQSAIDYLMDKEIEGDTREQIIDIINKTNGILSYHDLRITGMISNLFISLDIEVKPNITITEAHEIARSLEHKLIETFADAQVLIHIDPEGDIDDTRH